MMELEGANFSTGETVPRGRTSTAPTIVIPTPRTLRRNSPRIQGGRMIFHFPACPFVWCESAMIRCKAFFPSARPVPAWQAPLFRRPILMKIATVSGTIGKPWHVSGILHLAKRPGRRIRVPIRHWPKTARAHNATGPVVLVIAATGIPPLCNSDMQGGVPCITRQKVGLRTEQWE